MSALGVNPGCDKAYPDRIELDVSLACLRAASALFLAKPIGIFQPTQKLFIYITWGSELHLIMEAAL